MKHKLSVYRSVRQKIMMHMHMFCLWHCVTHLASFTSLAAFASEQSYNISFYTYISVHADIISREDVAQ